MITVLTQVQFVSQQANSGETAYRAHFKGLTCTLPLQSPGVAEGL